MRVTNEQATSDKICELYCPDCELSLSKPEDWKCPHGETSVRKYAADLLEVRELVKEMREVLDATRKTYSNEMFTLAKMRIDEVLERTKEYQ